MVAIAVSRAWLRRHRRVYNPDANKKPRLSRPRLLGVGNYYLFFKP